ncbi:MAG TPA: thiolase family protein [Acidimicrobiales bacterium]|nr:thiolase family protein [Acidimicrobiales bacterium]
MSDVRITGVGLHPFGRFEGVTGTEMGVVAVRAALAEAAVGVGQVQAAFCGTAYGGVAAGHRVLGALAGTGIPIYDVEAGCASGGAALQLGAASITSGQHDRVLVFGIEKMPRGVIRSSFFAPWQEAAGLSPAPAYFALRAQRLLSETGLTAEHLAQVVVKNRRHGAANPEAMFQKAVTVDEVLAARMICPPLTLFMLCSPNEGAAAVVLERARDGITVAGISLRSHLPGSVLGEDSPLCGIDDATITPPTTLAAEEAYAQAGLGPAEMDVVECQDTDAGRELLAWAELGVCKPGDQARIIEEGGALVGGALPVNPSGGLLSKGEPLGASALGQVVEIVRQLRGTAGARQVDGARVGLAHVIGRGANACVTVLVR